MGIALPAIWDTGKNVREKRENEDPTGFRPLTSTAAPTHFDLLPSINFTKLNK